MNSPAPSPTPEQLGVWVLCAIVFINLYFSWRASGKQKREVSIESVPEGPCARKEDLERHKEENRDEHEHLHSKIGSSERAAHKRMDELVNDYNEKFQQLPHQIIALMRNAGIIRPEQ